MSRAERRVVLSRRLATTAMLAVVFVIGSATLVAADPGGVHAQVTVNGQAASASSDAEPAQLDPAKPVQIRIDVQNETDRPIHIASVRFEGQVMDLPLFSFDTAVDLSVAPHGNSSLEFPWR